MGSGRKRKNIVVPDKKKGGRFDAKETASTDDDPILFSFERIQSGQYCFSGLDDDHKVAAADAIFKRRQLRWSELKQAGRHALGFEKMPVSQIKRAPVPKFITEDKQTLLVCRYKGLAPMVGYRVRQIFYILWFDHSMNLYDHE
ncbi:MAG: hypothetical protein ACJA0B_001499 [Alcanivorax borkumensis]|jgi:hypothetical protein|uniref:hypothetical protein n=1 Tax=Alcanivorax borkumensis TaxID=59754 RepID=UPI003EEB3D5D